MKGTTMAQNDFDKARTDEALARLKFSAEQIVTLAAMQVLGVRALLAKGQTPEEIRPGMTGLIASLVAPAGIAEFPVVMFDPGKGVTGYKLRLLSPEKAAQSVIDQARDPRILAS